MNFLSSYHQLHRACQKFENKKNKDEKTKRGEDAMESGHEKGAKMDCKDDDDDIIILEDTCANDTASSSSGLESSEPAAKITLEKPVPMVEQDTPTVTGGSAEPSVTSPESESCVLATEPSVGRGTSTKQFEEQCSESAAELDVVKKDGAESSRRGSSTSIAELECIQQKDLIDSVEGAEPCSEKSVSPEVHAESEANIERNDAEDGCRSGEQKDPEMTADYVDEQLKAANGKHDARAKSCDSRESSTKGKNESEHFMFVEERYPSDQFAPDRSKSDYYCDVCDAHMNNLKMWESHVTGKRHLKNLKKEPGERSCQIKSIVKEDAVPLLQDDLDKISEPVVGLSFMCEYERFVSGPLYSCFLCGGTMVKALALEHIMSVKHRLNFFKEVEPEAALLFENVQLNKDAKENVLTNKAQEWEAEHGRGEMEVRVEIRRDDLSIGSLVSESSREDRTASRKDHPRPSFRRESPDFRRDRYSPGLRSDRSSSWTDNREYSRRRSRSDFWGRTSPDRSNSSSRRGYRERSPDLRWQSNRHGLESDMQHAGNTTGRDAIIDAIVNLKEQDDIETKICLLEKLSVMPIETDQESQVAMHVIKILQDCVIYYKLRRLPKELQAAVAHKLIQEKPTVNSTPLNIPSAAMSSGVNVPNQFNSPEMYPAGDLSYGFDSPATFNSGRGYSPSLMGGYAASSGGGPGVPYPNAYNSFRGSSAPAIRPGMFQNLDDYRVSDLRNILDSIKNLQGAERIPPVSVPAMSPPRPVPQDAFNGNAFQSQSSSFRDRPRLFRQQ